MIPFELNDSIQMLVILIIYKHPPPLKIQPINNAHNCHLIPSTFYIVPFHPILLPLHTRLSLRLENLLQLRNNRVTHLDSTNGASEILRPHTIVKRSLDRGLDGTTRTCAHATKILGPGYYILETCARLGAWRRT